MGGECDKHERGKIHTRLQWGCVNENHLEDLGVDGITVLKLILEK
jgi:hypothetical protein